MAIGDFLGELIFGETPEIEVSGAFPNLHPLGRETSEFLLNRLRTPAGETDEFRLLAEALREQTGLVSRTQRQRLGRGAVSGGFLDSGAVQNRLAEIDRSEVESFTRGLRESLLALEQRRLEGVLPFLSAGAQEQLAVSGANQQAELASDQLFADFAIGATQLGLGFGNFFQQRRANDLAELQAGSTVGLDPFGTSERG